MIALAYYCFAMCKVSMLLKIIYFGKRETYISTNANFANDFWLAIFRAAICLAGGGA